MFRGNKRTRQLFQCSRYIHEATSPWVKSASTKTSTPILFAALTRSNLRRVTAEELRMREHLIEDQLSDLRQAAEAHRQVSLARCFLVLFCSRPRGPMHATDVQTRKYVQSWLKPGMAMTEIAERLETCSRALIGEQGLDRGALGTMECCDGVGLGFGQSMDAAVALWRCGAQSKHTRVLWV